MIGLEWKSLLRRRKHVLSAADVQRADAAVMGSISGRNVFAAA